MSTCFSDTTLVSVTHSVAPHINGTDGDGITLCAPDIAMLQAASDDPSATFLWTPFGQTSSSIMVNAPGVYTVIAVSASGCTSDPVALTVLGDGCVSFRVSFSGSFTYVDSIATRGGSVQSIAPADRVSFTNDGASPFDLGLLAISTAPFHVSASPGANAYRVEAIFSSSATEPASSAFVTANDLVPEGAVLADARYANGLGVFGGGGWSVPNGSSTNLWLLVGSPTYYSQPLLTCHLIAVARMHLP